MVLVAPSICRAVQSSPPWGGGPPPEKRDCANASMIADVSMLFPPRVAAAVGASCQPMRRAKRAARWLVVLAALAALETGARFKSFPAANITRSPPPGERLLRGLGCASVEVPAHLRAERMDSARTEPN
jgi:hypothetical protein